MIACIVQGKITKMGSNTTGAYDEFAVIRKYNLERVSRLDDFP